MTDFERRRTNGWGKAGIIIDGGMVVALAGLIYWVGVQADRIEHVTQDIGQLKGQVQSIAEDGLRADVMQLRTRADGQEKSIDSLKEYLGGRLDRIERKIDSK